MYIYIYIMMPWYDIERLPIPPRPSLRMLAYPPCVDMPSCIRVCVCVCVCVCIYIYIERERVR